jgi:1,4-alpha-glucan branching enzyme
MPWKATLGAVPDDRGTHFRIWAPGARSLELHLLGGNGRETTVRPMCH